MIKCNVAISNDIASQAKKVTAFDDIELIMNA